MSRHFGLLVLLFSLLLGGYFSATSIDVKDLIQSKCRIAGVDLVENQDRSKFNYTMAESACQALGLQLASKAQVEKARGYGYEMCTYGWVSEKYVVIPRIQNNENCGRNKTGVLSWMVDLSKTFSTYCFNASDLRINSCKTELMATQPPSSTAIPSTQPPSSTAMPTTQPPSSTEIPTTPTSGSTMAPTSLKTQTQTVPTPTTRPDVRTTLLYTTLATTVEPITQDTTLMMNTEPTQGQNTMAQTNERVVFGGLPTTLLILALMFFIAAVVLAICYIKKYKTHLFFTTKKEKKESVEAKVFKDTSGSENAKEEEWHTNGKEADGPPKAPGNSIEAEV